MLHFQCSHALYMQSLLPFCSQVVRQGTIQWTSRLILIQVNLGYNDKANISQMAAHLCIALKSALEIL